MALDKKKPILVVDDNQGVRQMIADMLRAAGFHNALYAENGRIGWHKLNTERPQLVILDWDMPVMTGMELLEKIRSYEEYEDLPVLMLTAHALKDDVLLAMTTGANNYIVKPFSPNTLFRKLEDIFGEPVI